MHKEEFKVFSVLIFKKRYDSRSASNTMNKVNCSHSSGFKSMIRYYGGISNAVI